MNDFCDDLFKTYAKLDDLETKLFRGICRILGDEALESFPCYHVDHDAYDSSVEIFLSPEVPKLTEEQARQIFNEFGFGIIYENQGDEGRMIYSRGGGFSKCSPHKYNDDDLPKLVKARRQIEKMQEKINKLESEFSEGY